MRRASFIVSFLVLLGMSSAAFAMSLDAAKAGGIVGERPDGYLGLVVPSAEAEEMVREINRQRRAEYTRIASENGQAREVVEQLAAQKAYSLTQRGHFLMDASGAWKKKP